MLWVVNCNWDVIANVLKGLKAAVGLLSKKNGCDLCAVFIVTVLKQCLKYMSQPGHYPSCTFFSAYFISDSISVNSRVAVTSRLPIST